ncbi:MAG: DEAD/DEAH box helicase family protein [Clostridiales bacterium]|nr:DEAD/DEAH box helicase family protein [Clostridiales bacterium]
MPANFDFLKNKSEYELFANACIEAEIVLSTSAAMSAIGSRKALELAVKWVYSADNTMSMPYKDSIQALIHEPSFKIAIEPATWNKLPYIIKLGNLAVHTEKKIDRSDAILSLKFLFEFIQWLDYCYGSEYEERVFKEELIPTEKVALNEEKIRVMESLIFQKDDEIKALRLAIERMSSKYTEAKAKHKGKRKFAAVDISEFQTRKKYIDVDLQLLGWTIGDDCLEEVEVDNMMSIKGKIGYVDYVLYGKDGLPLALIEAKRTSVDPNTGLQQAKLYADSLERKTGRRPIIFTTNGFETYIWDDKISPQRKVSGIFSKSDLEKLINRRNSLKPLIKITIDDRITDRYYQKEAIRAVCDAIEKGHRKHLLVMATGTGKTRTAASLTDVLSRGGHITNVLFLADRTALVKQAKDDFKNYLPDMSLCNLLSNKDDKNARIVFSTYPTMLNEIDSAKNEFGQKLYTPAHFDLIIIDEAHRSIFKKYRAIFEYFDSILVGLTATPKTDVDRNTYDFFEMEQGVPTYAYDYETAVKKDHVLVPYYNIEVTTKVLDQGITYDDLSEEEKEKYEEDFTDEEGEMPDYIPPAYINEFIFNQKTVDMVLEDLMTKGIKVAGGDRIGKTIIFAQNKNHAQYIVDRFNKLYPQYKGGFIKRVVCDDSYAQTIIDEFKIPDKEPYIAVSVDMLDTGIDVPEIVNLVFFKKVRSKVKFWQMIGRGTRLCKDLFGKGEDKEYFVIFDYLGNFEFFREHKEGFKGNDSKGLSEMIFSKRVSLIHYLQDSAFADEVHQAFRSELVDIVVKQIQALNTELVSVRLLLKYIEKYKTKEAFTYISELDKYDLITYLAPIVFMDDNDEYAKSFDNLMYGIMLAQIEGNKGFKIRQKQLKNDCIGLSKRATIPQIKEKLELINTILTDEFWNNTDILTLEKVRVELRDLIKFLSDESKNRFVYTNISDEVILVKEGEELDAAYDFTDYRLKVNRYIEENKNHIAIYKLRNNIPLTKPDYEAIEKILTKDLGTKEDYKRVFGDTPFGLLIRKIAKLEYDAAMSVFSDFINEQSLNQEQIVFINKIIDYVVQNGYIEDISTLVQPPFDKPHKFIKLFDRSKQKKIVEFINKIKENAINVVG